MIGVGAHKEHVGFATALVCVWTVILYKRDHVLGCPKAPSILYHRSTHLISLILYCVAQGVTLFEVQKIDLPTEFALSKFGRVLLALRRLRTLIVVRALIVTLWLLIVFYENAEETIVPVMLLSVHLVISVLSGLSVKRAVDFDNSRQSKEEQLLFTQGFKVAVAVDISVSFLWLLFNVSDFLLCHQFYSV